MTASLSDTGERMAMLPADIPRDAVIVTRHLQRDYDMGGEVDVRRQHGHPLAGVAQARGHSVRPISASSCALARR